MPSETFPSSTQCQPSGFIDGVWNPEDLVALPGSSWVIVSAMRSSRRSGALLAVNTSGPRTAIEVPWSDAAERGRVSPALFDPHGIAARRLADGRYELAVIDHGGGEAVDRLIVSLDSGTPTIVAGDRIVQPEGTSGNAVAFVPDGGFVLTSMFDPRDGDRIAKFARAEATGGVWRWADGQGWSRLGDLALSGANGIAVSHDGADIYVCEWAAQRVWRLASDGRPMDSIATDFLPDNLRWTADGRLILAGQSARPEAVFGCEARGEPCPLAFSVVAIDPRTLRVEQLLRASENDAASIGFGGATGALQVKDEIWVASFTGERIATFAWRGQP